MAVSIWVIAILIYVAFRLWYDGVRKPLTPEEVDKYARLFDERPGDHDEVDVAVMRKFLDEDDGKEFIMMNLVQYAPSPMKHPDTGRDVSADSVVQEYFKPFMAKLIRRAGHPVIAGRAVGGYIDAWNTPPDPGWHGSGLIRYRSRRDIVELALASADFDDLHKYKAAGLKQTISFPTQTQIGLYASPRVTVALVLALLAALLQIALT